jgi:hypothetical protein
MKYKIESQVADTTEFWIRDENGSSKIVDIWVDGVLSAPKEALETAGEFEKWLKTLVGKTIEIEEVTPLIYSTRGKVKIL